MTAVLQTLSDKIGTPTDDGGDESDRSPRDLLAAIRQLDQTTGKVDTSVRGLAPTPETLDTEQRRHEEVVLGLTAVSTAEQTTTAAVGDVSAAIGGVGTAVGDVQVAVNGVKDEIPPVKGAVSTAAADALATDAMKDRAVTRIAPWTRFQPNAPGIALVGRALPQPRTKETQAILDALAAMANDEWRFGEFENTLRSYSRVYAVSTGGSTTVVDQQLDQLWPLIRKVSRVRR